MRNAFYTVALAFCVGGVVAGLISAPSTPRRDPGLPSLYDERWKRQQPYREIPLPNDLFFVLLNMLGWYPDWYTCAN